jgi:tripartite-type tricarboxylate transporter receptor subunit TctC
MIKNLSRLGFAVLAALALNAGAQDRAPDFPSKPVTFVVGYPAGGPTDVLIRALAPRLASEWKQQVLVDNRPGANEAIGAQLVARAQPDGHTLLMATEVPLTLNPFLISKLQYDPQKDFAPVSLLLTSPLTLIVPAASPANTLKEFIALANSRKATKPLAYASAGPGGVLHLPMAMLAKESNVEMTHVPYRGVAQLLTDVVSGQVDAAWVAVAGAAPFVKDGRIKALAVGAPARVKALPQVPTLKETGVNPVQADFIFAVLAPAGTPPAVADKIAATIRKIMADPEFREKYIEPFGYVTLGSTPSELAQYLTKDRVLQAERVRVSGAKME